MLLVSLFTTESTRRLYWLNISWKIPFYISSNSNIPRIEKVPVYGQGECDPYKINPEYKKYIQAHPTKEIDIEECVRAKNLGEEFESIARINCKAKATLPDPYAPPAVLPTKISCQKIVGYDKVLKLYGISWFKVGFETR